MFNFLKRFAPAVPASSAGISANDLVGPFILVKGGTFDMGRFSDEEDNEFKEDPVHRVTLSDFFLGETEVTQAQWKAVMGNNPSNFNGCDQCPVEKVSWDDVQTFLEKLNSLSGDVKYRLPTEAEWEYAAQGGAHSKGYTFAGSNNLDEVAWYLNNSDKKTHPVKGKLPNELGLYDMFGNVWEWCSDWHGDYVSGHQTNPAGPDTGSHRVCRGGSWNDYPQDFRITFRSYVMPVRQSTGVGFRLARSVSN